MKPILNLLRLIKYLAAGIFIRKTTPEKAFPDAPVTVHPIESVVKTPELPAMDLFPAGRALQGSEYRFPSVHGLPMPGVLYDPAQGLVLDKRRRAIEDPDQVPMRMHWYRWKPFLGRNIEDISGNTHAFRSFSKHYYHLLTDHLPSLFMLGRLDWDFGGDVKLLLAEPLTKAEEYFVPRLCPEGVEIRLLNPDRLYRLENYLYVSHLSRRSAGCLPQDYLEPFLELCAPSRPRRPDKRIFISRATSGRRRIVNEEELYSGLARYGFECHRLEDLSIEEQIALFYDAEMVVSPHGAGLVNLLFSSRAKVLELFPGPLIRPHYYYICKSLGLDYRYLRMRRDYRFPRSLLIDLDEEYNGSFDDFAVDCKAVLRAVEKMGA